MFSDSEALVCPPGMSVRVTQEEIDTAIPANSGHCMIADAVKRDFQRKFKRKPLGVSVDLQTIRLTDCEKGLRFIYLTPPTAQRALLQFDQGIRPTPFQFKLSSGQTIESEATPSTRKRVKAKAKRVAAQRVKAMQMARAKKKAMNGKAKVVVKGSRNRGKTLVKIGGRVPPAAVLTGNRRQYGLKGLGDLRGPTDVVKPRKK